PTYDAPDPASSHTPPLPDALPILTAVARDAAGNSTTSAAVTVSVANDTTPPTISAVASSGVTATAATITWTTDEASDSQVDYGKTGRADGWSPVTASSRMPSSAAL